MEYLPFLTQYWRMKQWVTVAYVYNILQRKQTSYMTMGFLQVRIDLPYITNKPNFFSRVIICQLAFLFVIVLLFGFVPGKVVLATSFKTKKRPAYWTSFHYSQSFYFPCTDIIRNFPDLLTLQLDKKGQFSSYSSNFDQFSAVI